MNVRNASVALTGRTAECECGGGWLTNAENKWRKLNAENCGELCVLLLFIILYDYNVPDPQRVHIPDQTRPDQVDIEIV